MMKLQINKEALGLIKISNEKWRDARCDLWKFCSHNGEKLIFTVLQNVVP